MGHHREQGVMPTHATCVQRPPRGCNLWPLRCGCERTREHVRDNTLSIAPHVAGRSCVPKPRSEACPQKQGFGPLRATPATREMPSSLQKPKLLAGLSAWRDLCLALIPTRGRYIDIIYMLRKPSLGLTTCTTSTAHAAAQSRPRSPLSYPGGKSGPCPASQRRGP